jgi:DNA-binding NarL/FixJ family response regulator
MSCIHAASQIKSVLPNTPIILLTCHQAALGNFNVRAAGTDAVIAKGTEMSVLNKSVRHPLRAGINPVL